MGGCRHCGGGFLDEDLCRRCEARDLAEEAAAERQMDEDFRREQAGAHDRDWAWGGVPA